MSLVTDDIRAKATELYHGNDVCLAQSKRLLREVGLPNGLLPLQDVEECGYVEETGFVWVKQKKEIKHNFEKIGKLVSYATEVTAYVEECKIRKLTGVKAKEFLLWVTINEITIDTPQSEKIVFKNNATGISKVFPANAFVVKEAEVATKGVGSLKKKKVDEKKEDKVEVDNGGVAKTTNGVANVVKEV
ncbi:Glycerol kinase [Bienertia sinuspersici]